MSLENVREYLKKYNMEERILEFNHSSATVSDAALAIGTKEERIAKTLSFELKEKCIVIVVAGDKRIDNSKYKGYFHEKAKMISFDKVEDKIGHKVGGVCPFALKDNVDIYLDLSLKKFDYVYPACGSSNSAIKLNIEELENIIDFKDWIDVTK